MRKVRTVTAMACCQSKGATIAAWALTVAWCRSDDFAAANIFWGGFESTSTPRTASQ